MQIKWSQCLRHLTGKEDTLIHSHLNWSFRFYIWLSKLALKMLMGSLILHPTSRLVPLYLHSMLCSHTVAVSFNIELRLKPKSSLTHFSDGVWAVYVESMRTLHLKLSLFIVTHLKSSKLAHVTHWPLSRNLSEFPFSKRPPFPIT